MTHYTYKETKDRLKVYLSSETKKAKKFVLQNAENKLLPIKISIF